VTAAAREAVLAKPWCPGLVDEVCAMRARLEATASPRSLKRGPGGLVDVEFLVQLLQLKHGREQPDVLRPNLWDALDAIESAGLLPAAEAAALRDGYSFLRFVEARLRVVTDRPLTEVPEAAEDRAKLARRLAFPTADAFAAELARVTAAVRRLFREVTGQERVTG
jgi:[glutamine synthetase] adenylyltransferase / [glutamine synthetase]-adenylyl-L-tyrosine phosphorylase